MKTSVRIGAFEIDDGELHGESPGDRTLTIPCKSDPDLCMQLIVPLADSLKPGTYTVNWHVVSVDGHKTKGHYTFSVK